MARSYSDVIGVASLEEMRASVFQHAENAASNKGIKKIAVGGFIVQLRKAVTRNYTPVIILPVDEDAYEQKGTMRSLHGIIFVILALSLGILFGCGKQVAQSSNNASPAPSQRSESIKLQERWEQERARLDKLSKSYPANQLQILQSLIEKLLPEQQAGEFERVRSTSTSYQQMSDFDQNLLQVFVIKSVQQGDRTRLVYLLSGHCPRYISTDGIELYLALTRMPNPLMILFDSYAQAEKDTARSEIIEALASVFRDLRREHADDREFVDVCKQWYLNNQSKLKVNRYYQPNSDFSESRDFFVDSPS